MLLEIMIMQCVHSIQHLLDTILLVDVVSLSLAAIFLKNTYLE
jgi:hypothetical protein